MMIASIFDAPEKSVVGWNPLFLAIAISVSGIRQMYDRDAASRSTFLSSISNPVTAKPCSQNNSAKGSPT